MILIFRMAHSPIRIKRETHHVDKSKLHWAERVRYSVLFGFLKDKDERAIFQMKEDLINFMERNILKYEEITYRLRNKMFEKNENQISECIKSLSNQFFCNEGEACDECQFNRLVKRMDENLELLNKGLPSFESKDATFEALDFAFERIADLVIEKGYEVCIPDFSFVKKKIKLIKPKTSGWTKLADASLRILLEKLTVTSTKFLVDRMGNGQSYIATGDDIILNAIKRMTNEIPALEVLGRDITVKKEFTPDGIIESLTRDGLLEHDFSINEWRCNINIIANPTKSDLVGDVFVNADDVKQKMAKLGFICKTLIKRNINITTAAKLKRLKPKWRIGNAARCRIRKTMKWTIETIRINESGGTSIPAVIII